MENVNKTVETAIAYAIQAKGMLELIDKYRDNSEITLREVLSEFTVKYQIIDKEYYFNNQYNLIASLWTYVVLPKESFFDDIPKNLKIKYMDERWGLKKICNEDDNDMDLRSFIRKIRNAISHVNIQFNEKLEFRFWNVNNKVNDFDVTFNSQDLQRFANALSYWSISKDINLGQL